MKGFNNLILVVASKDKSTVFRELLNRRSEKELYIGSGIVCFVNDDDFMLRATRKRYRRRKVLRIRANSVKKRPSSDPLMT